MKVRSQKKYACEQKEKMSLANASFADNGNLQRHKKMDDQENSISSVPDGPYRYDTQDRKRRGGKNTTPYPYERQRRVAGKSEK
jgi:hypothetical protein